MLIAMTRTTRLVPFRGHETWVQITAPDDPRPGALPLFVLHGGPGMAHNYVRNIAELAAETGRTVIHYDQIGCGNSTHLPDAPADFWTPELFVDEFHTVREALGIDEYHLLGQSWGGMLSAEIAVRRPAGPEVGGDLQLARIDGALDGRRRRAAGAAAAGHPGRADPSRGGGHRHRPGVPGGDRRVLPAPSVPRRADATGPRRHHRADGGGADGLPHHERPQRVSRPGHAARVEHHRPAARITAPTLVIAGEFDEATPATWQPYVDHIPGAESHVFPDTSHCSHLEKPEEFRAVVAAFLASHDAVARI